MVRIEANVSLPGSWQHRMTLQDLLLEFAHAETVPAEDAVRVAHEVHRRLGVLAKRGGPTYPGRGALLDVDTAETFNQELAHLYGWCTRARVFVGEGA